MFWMRERYHGSSTPATSSRDRWSSAFDSGLLNCGVHRLAIDRANHPALRIYQNAGAPALDRGKVWPRGESEPGDWTIEAADETPNLAGSPGLFGNASYAEVFVDNVKVTAN